MAEALLPDLSTNSGLKAELKRITYPFSGSLRDGMRNIFHLRLFRRNQFKAINATMLGRDVLLLMATGSGKSLVYQLPALVSTGVTFVVSPLRSLVHDQVRLLNRLRAGSAASLAGDVDCTLATEVARQLYTTACPLRVVFVTPEKLMQSYWLRRLLMDLYHLAKIDRFVVDEAHCICTWGQDFRPQYAELGLLRERFPGVPIFACTATVNVRYEIVRSLRMREPEFFFNSFDRSNLRLEVLPKTNKVFDEIVDLIRSQYLNRSGIVYCRSHTECTTASEELAKRGVRTIVYHAGKHDGKRQRVQDDWVNDRVRVVVATMAFGLGVNKPNVRFVIHVSLPTSIEGYYQEIGRAGRDAQPARCLMFYRPGDVQSQRTMLASNTDNFDVVESSIEGQTRVQLFCENVHQCRRQQVLIALDDPGGAPRCTEAAEKCDVCRSDDVFWDVDCTALTRKILLAVRARLPLGQCSIAQLVDMIIGKFCICLFVSTIVSLCYLLQQL